MAGSQVQIQPLPTPPTDQDCLSSVPKSRFTESWNRWFLAVQKKVNVITASLVNFASTTFGAGIISSDGSGNFSSSTLTQLIDAGIGSTQGDILYRNATAWVVLPPGTSGYTLQTNGSGANPTWAAPPASGGNPINVNIQTGLSYTLALSDAPQTSSYRGWIGMNNAAANTVLLSLHSSVAFPIGTNIDIANYGAGQTTLNFPTGVTILGPAITGSGQYSLGRITQVAIDTWWISGNIPYQVIVTYTWNPSDKSSNITLSNGNLTATMTGTNTWSSVRGLNSHSSGKYYFEVLVTTTAGDTMIGVSTSSMPTSTYPGGDANGWGYYALNGQKYHSGTGTTFGSSYNSTNVVGIAVDISAGNLWFSLGGVWQASGNPSAGTNPAFTGVTGSLFPTLGEYDNGNVATGRFSVSSFQYTPPTGFGAW